MNNLVLRNDLASVAVLTLNRPEKLNALSPELFLDLRHHLRAISAVGSNINCVLLKGAGRSFCAGADLNGLRAGMVTDEPELRSETVELLGRMPQAVIVAVHGHCFTGGLELALAGDLIVATETARFCDTHAKLGIVPRWGMSARLPRRIGLAAAKKLSFSATPIDAAEALRIGLCDQVVSVSEFEQAALSVAASIAGNVPASIAAIKHLYEKGTALPIPDALAYERAYTPVDRKKILVE